MGGFLVTRRRFAKKNVGFAFCKKRRLNELFKETIKLCIMS